MTRFEDCVMGEQCACSQRDLPPATTTCQVPAINALAVELGFEQPYEVDSLEVFIKAMGG